MANVVIVGAGPTGATLALLLVQRGISVQLVEASRTFRRQFRGEGLMPSGLEALKQMGLSAVLDRLPHRPLEAWEFWLNRQFLFRVEEPIEPAGQPCTLVSQPALLEALVQEARTFPQFELIQGTPVQDLLWEGERVTGVRLKDGRECPAALVIGTDGRHSLVRQQANLGMEERSASFDILWFRLADSPRLASENVFYSILQGPNAFGLFRSSEGNVQVGWALRPQDANRWPQVDWVEKLASASPSWLAEHFRECRDSLERPVLLSVVVGCCPQWSKPGVLLLGDAAHPMSPIRAQGINMALRDSLVAANHLVPLLSQGAGGEAIAPHLPAIQAARESEIRRIQQLQQQETAQADLLSHRALLRWAVSQTAPLIRQPIRYSWLRRQRLLRQGLGKIQLQV